MGRSIGLCAARAGLTVRLFDADVKTAESAAVGIAGQLPGDAPQPQCIAAMSDLGDCEALIEAVVENRAVKRRVLAGLAAESPDALIATNTSSLSIGELSGRVERAERFCGMHFCHPIAECPLVEIVPGPSTDERALNHAESLAQTMGLQPLRTRDLPGFAVNRLLFPYLEAAVALVRGGVDWRRIDGAAVDFGMRLGPLAQMDEIGIDVILRAAAAFHRGNPVVPPQSELLLAMFQAARLGRKSGRGFYSYAPNGELRHDAEAKELSDAHRTDPIYCTDEDLQLRLFVPLFVSACELIEKQVVAGTDDVRAALIRGLGCRRLAADLPGWGRSLPPGVIDDWTQRLALTAPNRSAMDQLLAE